ncbi:DUF2721 domain-containing protein [Sphingomonas aracearum]|uniref:DUF2721 domain-containing protein n=1 Tax=Sphingomonas aracearum TaxID=2283317 RepID=A0A369VZK7_9SPHN|nr:DUF2721 domain-containing protein [Sphingomonas aracearum]RDE07067.1 DUF2721 domain-containing protein [Sphingomonas aracearum]
MMQLADFLKAIGPNASIVFASWIFMGFLQQRYDGAVNRYREAVGDYRSNEHGRDRGENLMDQVTAYHRRCRLMEAATLVGLCAAILLILSLLIGGLDVLVPHVPAIAVAGVASASLGLALVIVAAAIVIWEGVLIRRQLNNELRDLPDLAHRTGNNAGSVLSGERH